MFLTLKFLTDLHAIYTKLFHVPKNVCENNIGPNSNENGMKPLLFQFHRIIRSISDHTNTFHISLSELKLKIK